MKRIIQIFAVSCLFVSCNVYFQEPLTTPEDAVVDSSLTGIWEFVDLDDEVTGYAVIALADSKLYKTLDLERDEDRLYKFGEVESFLVTEIADRYFISLIGEEGYLFANYVSVNDSTINLYFMDEDFLKREVSRNRLTAEHAPDSLNLFRKRVDISSIKITSTTEQLRDYFSNVNLDSAFTYSGRLIRVVN